MEVYQMPNNYCGVKLNVAGFDIYNLKTLQRLGQINQRKIVLLT
ncbi:MAG: hypothetical protein AVDCRST_MAG74-3197 [uncultured Pyrinomonadaceae bacterium]|uniref:Uncharacterized protein n=1 Tax=uncultured Pyrinomonadaceae bacterium TaxID=2283094 RepID=A0A6J4PS24_9BACT|nr:MAG: hypothetical protein AVDCRST_MAG74-3197 [uncultured Pyrinomonadaceae bacterium]